MNKISTYFRESYKELTEKSELAKLEPASAVDHDSTGGNLADNGNGLGNGLYRRERFKVYL